MKKITLMAMALVALMPISCSKDSEPVSDIEELAGMTLSAQVEQPAESRATFSGTDGTGNWTFSFSGGDKIMVTNNQISGSYYTFTNNGTDFSSADARKTTVTADWYAYYPGNTVDLTGQAGTATSAANLFAYAGAQQGVVAYATNLSMTMSSNMAILKIVNKGIPLNINIKNSSTTYVKGMTATGNAAAFNVTTDSEKQILLTTKTDGTYFIAVPAGIKLEILNNDTRIGTTNGFTAGKYYTLTFPDVIVPGEYSVSPTLKVKFAHGNLKYQASTGTYAFFDNQYEAVGGYDNTAGTANWRDLFYYTTVHTTVTNNTGCEWRRLTETEWQYMMARNSGKCYANAKYSGTEGLLIFPDGFDYSSWFSGNTSKKDGINELGNAGAGFPGNNISDSDWANLQTNGVVFLPVAGYARIYDGVTCQYWGKLPVGKGTTETQGNYWTSDAETSDGGRFFGFWGANCGYFTNGNNILQSIRLVVNVN